MFLLFIPIILGSAFITLFIAAILLRIAVIITNRAIGPVQKTEAIGWDWDADEDKADEFPAEAELAIPKPSIWSGMRIVFLVGITQIIVRFGLDSAFRGSNEGVGIVLLVAVGVASLIAFLAWLLPTTIARATLVAFFSFLLLIALGLLFGGSAAVLGI